MAGERSTDAKQELIRALVHLLVPLGWYLFGFGDFMQFLAAWFGSFFAVFLWCWTLDMRRTLRAARRDLTTVQGGGNPDAMAAQGRARHERTTGAKLAATLGVWAVVALLTALFCVLPWQAIAIGLAPSLAILIVAAFATRRTLMAVTMQMMAIMDVRVKALMEQATHPVVVPKPPPYLGPALSELPALPNR